MTNGIGGDDGQDPARNKKDTAKEVISTADSLITSSDPLHPANHIASLCRQFYTLGWVTGTGGGVSIKYGDHIYLAPSGVQKELMKPEDMFVMDYKTKEYVRRPAVGAHCPRCSCVFSVMLTRAVNKSRAIRTQ